MEQTRENNGLKNRWLIVAVLLIIAVSYTVMQFACSAYLQDMILDSGMSGAQAGTFNGVQSLSCAFMMVFGAYMAYRLGAKKCYALGAMLTLIVGLCLNTANYPMMVLGRLILGLSNGMTGPVRGAIVSTAFGVDKRKATLAMSISGSGFFLGRYAGLALAYPVLEMVGSWQKACIVLGLLGAIGAILWWLVYPGAEEYQCRNNDLPGIKALLEGWKTSWKIGAVRKHTLYIVCSGISGQVFNAFVVMLIATNMGLEAAEVSAAVSYSGLLGLAGSIIGGIIGSRFMIKSVIIPAELISGVCMLIVSYIQDSSLLAVSAALMCLHSFCQAAQSINHISLLFKQPALQGANITSASSLIYAFFYGVGYLSSQIFGIVYPMTGMRTAMFIWSIPVIIGGFVACTINEPKYENEGK